MALIFHNRKGSLVTLSNENRTAQRNHPAQEFNNGVIMSSEPLQDNHLFEVRLDRKINSWSGSIEIGVTTCDPNNLEFPSSATDLREGSWIMSGSSILKDGRAVIEEYGHDLDQLCEGDKVAVMRTSDGCLHFFVNGIDQGQAGSDIPPRVFVVVDMYGKCAQVTITDSADAEDRILSNVIRNENTLANSASQLSDRLRFHERCGSLIKLSNNNRTAERRRPLDEFNNGVVMTHRQLRENELFEIRLDRLVDKWSGSIEVGITTHNPANLEFPATMTNMRSGTIMMSGCGILTNGKGTRREYGEYNLDELKEGDRIGLMRKSNGTLHYFINGFDQGVASSRTPNIVFGVVDLYGMAVKVTIVDNEEATIVENNVTGHINNSLLREQLYSVNNDSVNLGDTEKLLFHTRCGSHAAVINNGRTAHRPNASEEFNNGVILSNRPLKNNELFEVRIDKMVDKWVGSIEIGVTTHTPLSVEFPFTMTNIRSGTWMMTGKGVMHNGTTVLDEYGQNLDSLKVGDRVGVLRKENGSLHFFVNGRDQGVAATNLPEKVYAVLDLFGQAAQATLIDQEETFLITDGNSSSAGSTNSDLLRFHHLHGRNSTIINNGLTAVRPNAHGEFNDAIVMSNRPLREGEMFEVIIEKMVDRWSGSIEAGVTAIKPEDIEFPNTMTDIDYDTWMLSGSAVMQDGSTIRNGYKCDLDTLGVGSRIGMMRHSDATLHYYINGEDQGMACTDIPPEIYAVIDLYGQCAQVSIVQSTLRQQTENHIANEETEASISLPPSAEVTHRFSQCCGKNITLRNNGCTACRIRNFDHGLVFSSLPLKPDELFEIKIDQLAKQWSGSLQIGLTNLPISDSYSVSNLPATALELRSKVTWLMCGSQIKKNGVVIRDNYGPSLDRLEVGTRIGVKYCTNGTMHICINGEDLGICAYNIPKKVFAIVDAYGVADMVTIVSSSLTDSISLSRPPSIHSDTTSDVPEHDDESISKEPVNQEFHENYGRNIQLINNNMSARRTASYNQGIVVCSKPLPREKLFQVRIDKLNPRWTSSILIGIIGWSPEKLLFPMTASGMKKLSWIICNDSLFYNGVKVKEHYGPNLDCLQVGHLIGVKIDICNCLHLYVNGVDHGVAAKDIPKLCYALVDLYGQCEQVSITTPNETVPLCNEVFPQQECNKEKIDKDEGKKEKICRTSEEPAVIKNCEYQNLCSRFKATLSLPDGYFNPDYNLCYCENCLKLRGDEAYHKRGDPPREYAIPFGWCRFMIRIPPKVENLNVLEKWHVAYHGTIIGAIRKILDHGEILLPSDITFGGNSISLYSKHQLQKNKSKDLEMTQIILSPTVQYTGNEIFSPGHEYIDPRTKKKSQARVAFQVFARPGSYKVGPQSIGANEPIDQRIGNNDIEWTTKERGATVLYALLIKIEV